MRPLPEHAAFSLADLRNLSWSDLAARRAATAGRIVRVRNGWFTAADIVTPVAATQAAVGAHADSAASDLSALTMLELPIVGELPRVPTVTVAPRGTGRGRGAHIYRASLRAEDVVLIGTTPSPRLRAP